MKKTSAPGEKVMTLTAKGITSFTKHPMKMPQSIGLLAGICMGDFTMKDYRACKKKKMYFKTSDGSQLFMKEVYCPKDRQKNDGIKRIIILPHGFGNSCNYMLRYASIYFEKGYDCVIYDQRGHGKSSKYAHSMGYFEGKDLAEIAKSLRKKYGKDAIIGVHGESMGSATTYMSMPELAESADFAVCDCGYSNMSELAAHIAKLFFFMPKKRILELVDEYSEVDGKRYSDVLPIERMKETSADFPVYFIHGGGDFFIPTEMTKKIYEVKKGKKKLSIYGKAFHACSQFLHKEEYRQNIFSFLEENNIK